jgi:hypothetical protein
VANENPQPIEVTCILRVVDFNTLALVAYSKTQTVVPDGSIDFTWELEDKAFVLPSIACNLPPNGVISGIIALYVDY